MYHSPLTVNNIPSPFGLGITHAVLNQKDALSLGAVSCHRPHSTPLSDVSAQCFNINMADRHSNDPLLDADDFCAEGYGYIAFW